MAYDIQQSRERIRQFRIQGGYTQADKFYIKSSGTVYLDELRVTTGSRSSTRRLHTGKTRGSAEYRPEPFEPH